MSSKRVRFEPSDMATFLLTLLRRGQVQEGVELVLLQGGAVRAKQDYEAGPFLMGDLFKEIAFECHQAIIDVPGHIIAESIKNTRTMAKPAPNFLHVDEGVKVDDAHEVLEIAGQPFDPDRVYRLSMYQMLLTGLNVIEPIYSYVVNNMPVPDEEACRPAKSIIMEVCMKDAWRHLLGMETSAADVEMLNSSGGGNSRVLTKKASVVGTSELERLFDEIDEDKDGVLTKEEIITYFTKKVL